MRGWVGVDFDGTVSHYTSWIDAGHVGAPVAVMCNRVQAWLRAGHEVRIFTARLWPISIILPDGTVGPLVDTTMDPARIREAHRAAAAIAQFCERQWGQRLPITCVKDMGMIELWDDRAVQVTANTGEPVGTSTRGL